MNKTTKHKFLYFGLLLLMATASFSISAQVKDDKTLSPYFFVKGDPRVDQLPLKGTNVEIAVSGVIADVRVSQTYRNEGSRPINATYMFPASTRTAVYSMRMKIGDPWPPLRPEPGHARHTNAKQRRELLLSCWRSL